jgi:hypothetical protein
VADGRHRYDASTELRHQRAPGRDPGSAYRRTDTTIRHHSDRSGWHWLLLVPIIASLLSPYYNRMEPTVGGMPFFYWFPLSLNLVAAACMLTVHLATKRGL